VTIDKRPPGPLDLICPSPSDFYSSFADYFSDLEKSPPTVNVIAQVGHASLRVGAMDSFDRAATDSEIEQMKGLLRQALKDGAAGLSTGLYYPPANAAPTEEIEALAQVLHEEGGFHSTHMRDEGDGVMDSLEETFRIGRTANVPIIISHHKCVGMANHGRSSETLPFIEAARAKQQIGMDVYPYIASSTILQKTPVSLAARTLLTWSEKKQGLEGRDLEEVAAEMGLSIDETIDAISPAGAIYFMMDERDVKAIMAFPATMIGSDGLPHDRHPHPRLWGTFPRVLGHYSREEGIFPLETAVHKMTGLTARTFGLKDRGILREGAYADLVLFDPATVNDTATFERPQSPADGISQVFVNGQRVWHDGAVTDARPGLGLRGETYLTQ
jgi:N-acyl-D-amino-acid deacylase